MIETVRKIEAALTETIGLFEELIQVLESERTHLKHSRVESLWAVTEEKQAACRKIEKLRVKMIGALDEANVRHGFDMAAFTPGKLLSCIPKEHRPALAEPASRLEGLMADAGRRAAENKQFVEIYLKSLDDLIGVIIRREPESMYKRPGQKQGQGPRKSVLLHAEV